MAAAQEPPTKKAKTDEEEPTEPAPRVETEGKTPAPTQAKELEEDAPISKKPLISEKATFHIKDTTLNILPSVAGDILKPMTDGGFDNLLAGARASVGMKSGRYMYEVKILESLGGSWGNQSRPFLQVGFSTSSADLFVGDGVESVCFDSSGNYAAEGKKASYGHKWGNRGEVLGVLLNLDKKSPNFNTISLFKNGTRVSLPQALPDALKNKTLFPALTFRGATVHVNFARDPHAPLPFTCRMIGKADQGDVDAIAAPVPPKDGKYDALFPVGLPEEGSYDWLDMFLKKNPKYTELSERSLLSWCQKSGVWRKGGYDSISSRDRPDFKTDIKPIDDGSVMKVLYGLASLQPRDFIIMDLKTNLVRESRTSLLLDFPRHMYKRIAHVAIGEPNAEFKKLTQENILLDKQAASDKAHKRAFQEEKGKWALAKRQKQFEREKKKHEKNRLKALEEAKKKMEASKAAVVNEEKKEGVEEKKEGDEEKKEEEPKPEEKAEEPEVEEEEPEEPEEPEPIETDPPKVELVAEEKAMKFRPSSIYDFTISNLSSTFSKFSVPSKDDGFDDVRFEWSKGPACEEYIKKWVLAKKRTTRIEDLTPSTWFEIRHQQWKKASKEWNASLAAWKSKMQKKEADKKAKDLAKAKKAAEKAAAAKAAALQKEIAAKKAAEEGAEKKEEAEEDKKEEPEPEKEEEAMEAEEEEEEELPEFDDLDVFSVQDVVDIGGGMPLFKDFGQEDWVMTGLRFELSLLVHAFRKDANDPERAGISLEHLGFYFQKYFKKAFNPKNFGVETAAEVVALVDDTVHVKNEVLGTLLAEEYEQLGIFAKLTEEARRQRAILLDLGDESARLKISTTNDKDGGKGKWDNGHNGYWDGGKGKWDNAWDNAWGKGGGKEKGSGKQWGKQPWGGGGYRTQPYSGKW